MDGALKEILSACKRALQEKKNGTLERSALFNVVQNLSRCLQRADDGGAECETTAQNPKDLDGTSVSGVTPPSDGRLNPEGASPATSQRIEGTPDCNAVNNLDGTLRLTPQLCFLSDNENLNYLSFACRIALVGDGDTGDGKISGGSTKALLTSLELAAIVLNSGVLPSELECVPPTLSVVPSVSSGFFSKLLRSSALPKSAPMTVPLEDTPNSKGGAITTSPPALTLCPPSSAKVFIRESLVDAVIASADAVQSREPNETLWFIFIAALVAAALPRASRANSQHLQEVDIRYQTLELHGPRLLKVVQLLFLIFSRSNISTVLLNEAKSALHQIVKALSKYAEIEIQLAEPTLKPENVKGSGSDSEEGRDIREGCGVGNSKVKPGGDLVQILEFCSSVAAFGPLAPNAADSVPATPPLAGTGGTTTNLLGDKGEETASFLASYCNYTALQTSLNFILHITVNGDYVFRKAEPVIQCIRQSVIPAAVRTSLSSETDIFRPSLNILLRFCITYGSQLVNETSMIFRHVFFRVLGSKFTSLMHKSMVIEVFRRYIEEPQHLLELFLNYDCSTHFQSIYEEMINYLGALSRPASRHFLRLAGDAYRDVVDCESAGTVRLDFEVPESLRRKALTTLLLVTDSHIQWIERFETTDQGGAAGPSLVSEEGNDTAPCELVPMANPRGSTADDHAVEGDGAEQPVAPLSTTASSQSVQFLQARQYKDAVKRFLHLFNDKATNSNAAIQYLQDTILAPKAAARAVTQPEAGAAEGGSAEDAAAAATARKTARFLYENGDYLDKLTLGEYFARSFRAAPSRLVFEEWIKLHDFSNMKLDEALRLFLGEFKLLGEAQNVDRTMELFAAHYCCQNPGEFSSANTAFILAFSICMLNTDAHSTHIKNKMTVEDFIKNNKGIDEEKDLDPGLLIGIYNRITQKEIILRPSKYLPHFQIPAEEGRAGEGGRRASWSPGKHFAAGILNSIPILRRFASLTATITDKVLLPADAIDSNPIGLSQRKRKKMLQAELRAALKEMMDALQMSHTLPSSVFVSATRIENALPMWEISVDLVCRRLLGSLLQLFEESEQYTGAVSGSGDRPSDFDPVEAYMQHTQSGEFFQILLHSLTNIVRVCCSFGNVSHTEMLLAKSFQMTQLPRSVVFVSTADTSQSSLQVSVTQGIPRTRLELLACFFNLFVRFGAFFTAKTWQVGYTAVSLLDALANGLEGMWMRQSKRLQRPDAAGLSLSLGGGSSKPDGALPQLGKQEDLWFGHVKEVPFGIATDSIARREAVLDTIRSFPISTVDLWLERLFDGTRHPPMTQIRMANGLVKVCRRELEVGRIFALSKLFDFVSVCASFTTRLQWRELWSKASEVFIMAGQMGSLVANLALDGLRIIALTYLMREELLNYSFQKEVLKPFEIILMTNQELLIRRRVIGIIMELIDLRAEYLASGWSIVFSCLSHAAVIPDVVGLAWEICECVMSCHIGHVEDCFSDLIFCLTTFACAGGDDERIPLRAISYMMACAHWMQYGLEAPPPEVREAADVSRWACRFCDAETEAAASRKVGKNFNRVSLSPEPLSTANPLRKPTSSTVKTNYHLWVSLFEGMIPIIAMRTSLRVRCHAICSIWALVKHYGGVFADEVQDSFFSDMLRPVLTTLLGHVADTAEPEADSDDYRLPVYLSLRGMLLACVGHAHLLELCCDTLFVLMSGIIWARVQLLQNGLVDAFVRICCDFLAAAAGVGSDTMGLPFSTMSAPPADRGSSSVFCATCAMQGEEGAAALDAPLPTHFNFVSLLDEIQQVGAVDIARYERTASWIEVQRTLTVTAPSVVLDPLVCNFSTQALVRDTVLRCLHQGLLLALQDTTRAYQGPHMCLLSRAMRHVFLALGYFCIVTKNMEPMFLVLEAAERPVPPVETEGALPIKFLWAIPYSCVLLEFVFACSVRPKDTEQDRFKEKCAGFIRNLVEARRHCMDQQDLTQCTLEEGTTEKSFVTKSCKGSNFFDIFHSACVLLSDRHSYCTMYSAQMDCQRIFFECKYLCYLLSLRFVLTLQQDSFFASCLSSATLLDLLVHLPSVLEERTVSSFLESVWEELGLHCSIPEKSSLEACVKLVGNRLNAELPSS